MLGKHSKYFQDLKIRISVYTGGRAQPKGPQGLVTEKPPGILSGATVLSEKTPHPSDHHFDITQCRDHGLLLLSAFRKVRSILIRKLLSAIRSMSPETWNR